MFEPSASVEGAKAVSAMTTADFLSALRARDVHCRAEAGRLCLNAPREALTADLQQELTRRKEEILSFLRSAENAVPPGRGLSVVPRGGDLPLSFAQERLWFLQRLDPESVVYNLQAGVSFPSGDLDIPALERTLTEIVRRHEPLRTRFEDREGRPVQLILPPAPVSLPVDDLSSLAETERAAEAARRATEEVRRPFDIERGPLLRVRLLRFASSRHRLLLTQHHLVTDGWSIALLVEEVLNVYAAFSAGRPSPLAEPRFQYADFASWQREWLSGEVLERQLSYWKERLRGAPPALELPTDRPRPPVETFRGANLDFELPKELAEVVIRRSRAEGVTVFMTLLAAFKALLARHTGVEDIVVGTANGNRMLLETEPMLGMFVNSLVLRTDLSGDPTVRELLDRVRRTVLEAHAHGDLPFEKLVEELKPERDLSRSPLFQVLFVMQNTPLEALVGKEPSGVIGDRGTAAFDLSFYLTQTERGFSGTIEYNTDLFDASTAASLRDRYALLLEGVAADAKRRLSEIPFPPEEERRALATGSETPAPVPARPLHEQFEAQAGRRPASVAVSCGKESFTYAELRRRAERLAARLQKRGVGPGALVGLHAGRSASLAVGLMGILKAGAGYVPLDPAFPPDRLRVMLADARPAAILTEEGLRDRLPASGAALLSLDGPEDDGSLSAVRAADEDLAYVIFTSGSTGRPKGVGVTHRALRNVVASMEREVELADDDVLVAVTTLGFDIATLEMLLPLLAGARVEIANHETASDPRALAQLLDAVGATALQATPATWRMLVEAGWGGRPGLKAISGGEALTPDLARALRERCGTVWNMYGPTETTIYSIVHRVGEVGASVPIGRPVANTRVYLLDRHLQPVPVGVRGELCIGGVGLARGYLERPDLTAERFLPDPFATEPGSRLYRTGDLGRARADGAFEYLGRLDDQLKLRGFRIEPGEIEAALREHEAVQSAVVVGRGRGDDRQLVAYVVFGTGLQPTVTELRQHLKRTLPAHLVPSSFLTLDSLPRTPSGKVDRRALADLVGTRTDSAAPRVEPRTPMEHLVAAAWQEALGIERLSIYDNFFDVGGHSLLSMRVLARLERTIGVRLGPRELIFQTLEQFAALCEERRRVRDEAAEGAA